MRLSLYKKLNNPYFWIPVLLLAGCNLEKQSRFNRSMQNLTAHYNILFNANDILAQKQEGTAVSYIDAYDRFLSVYPDTTTKTATADKMLEAAIAKAYTIINTKEQSHYIGDAYLVLGKANYMENNFFNSIEFLNQVILGFPKQKNLVQEARVWKARGLMRIDQMDLADTVLRTAMDSIFKKQKNIADVYATRLQYDIYTGHFTEAEEMAKQAIHYSGDINHKLRWTFILGQLQEYNHKPADAVISYTRVQNSNAPFGMSFNASLNLIRIQEHPVGQSKFRSAIGINPASNTMQSNLVLVPGKKITRIEALRQLLKEDKNADFIDQIYYQMGQLYLSQGDIDLAIKNFKLSARKSTINQNQKGLSYLRIADINFKDKADYPNAKKYYDSTLISLSPNYPGYQAIYKKANNLQLLTDRLQTIAREDTLQMLARLSEPERAAKITTMVTAIIAQQKTISGKSASNALNAGSQYSLPNSLGTNNTGGSTFYFYNSSAVSQGFTDFKRVWGNRQLADNWRRSVKSGSESNNVQVAATLQGLNPTSYGTQSQKSTTDVVSTKIQQDLLQNIPTTPGLLIQSNARILNAYVDIANFYRDVLNDKQEAINTYDKVLVLYPNNNNVASVYYNLYRLYSDIDQTKSNYYKNLILKKYPETNFAKVILDPDFNQKLNDRNAEYTAFYNQLFDQVTSQKYPESATRADELIQQYPNNSLTAQVYYLRAIALGHTQSLEPFKAELQEIVDKFPDDRLVTPLVKQHLDYIVANKAELEQRNPVLVDSDPNEIPFLLRPVHVDQTYFPNRNIPKQQPAVVKTTTPAATKSTITAPGAPAEEPKEAPSMFSLRDSTQYYFVVNVATNTVNLAPSRFGIGQFNRSNLPQGTTVKHQLKPISDHQLIYVGKFSSLGAVKDYARAIVPLLPNIIKVPADKYTFFIITQENLDKLADQKTLDSYFNFYQKHY
ncbi:MAG: tetratricopeptide repeat protein [Mucilaginibacter sp.]|uniref:type IX secretion system periplasmic lipoprotein PorW/SprE n=1 Tax=Mucilaginibacter sp. TaxID=1882438 RepID=UPI003263183D